MSKRFSLGREDARKADVLLTGSTISAMHAELHIDQNGRLSVCDLGSSNGTSILRKGSTINVSSQLVPLASSDILSLGGKSFSMEKVLMKFPRDGNISNRSVSIPQVESGVKMMRCLVCGSVTPVGSACVECGSNE